MLNLIRAGMAYGSWAIIVAFFSATSAFAADAPAAPSYLLKGDYQEMRSKNSIRFLIHGEADHLPRSGDPRAAERALAQKLANRLGVTAVFISVAEPDDLIDQLNDGHGDEIIVGSLAITAARSKRIAFSRPIRFVDQLVVVHASDTSIQGSAGPGGPGGDGAGEGSSYAEALDNAKVKGIRLKVVPPTMQTFDLLQKVGRGEEKITVADYDLYAAASAFAPNIRSAFKLVEKQPIAWGLRRNNPDLKAAIDTFLVEHALTQDGEETYFADLDEIKKRKVLRMLTRNTSTTFFIYKGEQLGFEYELRARVCEEHRRSARSRDPAEPAGAARLRSLGANRVDARNGKTLSPQHGSDRRKDTRSRAVHALGGVRRHRDRVARSSDHSFGHSGGDRRLYFANPGSEGLDALTYKRYRHQVARALLLGLEILVAADVIRTVALEGTLQSVLILGLLVLIRTFLGWSLVVEIEERWPWQTARQEENEGLLGSGAAQAREKV